MKCIFALIFLSLFARVGVAEDPILERLDHFLAASENSEELFQIFSERFQLPIVWPHESYDGFASGGVSVGGSVLELISYPDFKGNAYFSAIAFVPVEHTPTIRRQLARNDVILGANDPYTVTEEGETHILWETFNIASLTSPKLRVFVCDYKYREFVTDNRNGASGELKNRNGGPLGVIGLAEIRIGTPDVTAKGKEWSKLELQHSDGHFSASDGARISLSEHPDDEIIGIALKVRSMKRAANWLADQGILGGVSASSVQIAPEAVQGLSVSLIE